MSTSRGSRVSADPFDDSNPLAGLRSKLHLTSAVLAVFKAQRPEPEGVLAAEGVDAARLRAWCGDVGAKDPHWREARRAGVSHAEGRKSAGPLQGDHILTVTLPASLDRESFWYLACAREAAFGPADEREATLTLRQQQVAMDHVGERGMRRVLVGRDDYLLHADPATEALLASMPEGLCGVLDVLRPMVEQRWGQPRANAAYDTVVPLPLGSTWVRLRRRVPVAGLPGYLHLELRPTTPDDPPAVGVLSDDRLAKALAFLFDQYAASPSLEEVANAVHVSPFHFHRLFSKAAGVSPKHYLLRLQLMIAKWQLRSTYRPVSDIAADAGFASHGHFTATFHRMVGVSPTTYREREGG